MDFDFIMYLFVHITYLMVDDTTGSLYYNRLDYFPSEQYVVYIIHYMCKFAILRQMNFNLPLKIEEYLQYASFILNICYGITIVAFRG